MKWSNIKELLMHILFFLTACVSIFAVVLICVFLFANGIPAIGKIGVFKRVFKTITVDNGSEFADAEGLQRSIINEGEKRTKVYYCHPYSSWERGTNEVTNKMIRRKIPKGTNFDDRTEEEVESIENWINGYPRKIHGYHSAGELFEEEVKQLA